MANGIFYFIYILQKCGCFVELKKSLKKNIILSTTFFHYNYIQMLKRKRVTSQILIAIHLPNLATYFNFNLFLFIQSVFMEMKAIIV